MFLFQHNDPFIVTVVHAPEHQTTVLDLFLGSAALTALAVLLGMLLGALFGFVLVQWHRRRPEHDRLPPVSPLVAPRPPTAPTQ